MWKAEENHMTCMRALQCDKQKLYKYSCIIAGDHLPTPVATQGVRFYEKWSKVQEIWGWRQGRKYKKLFYTISPIKQGKVSICAQLSLPLELKRWWDLEMMDYITPHSGGYITTYDGHFQKHVWPHPRPAKTMSESEALEICKIQATGNLMLLGFPFAENPPLSSDLWSWELWCLKDSSDATKHDRRLANTGSKLSGDWSP